LLIDENPLFLRAATNFLQRQKKLVVLRTAAGVEAALVGARDFRPTVIVLDPSAFRLDGLGIIPRLRTVLPEVWIVVLALIDSATYREAALAVGADCFVSKSDMVTDLLPAIRRAAHSSAKDSQAGELPAGSTLKEEALASESAD